MTGAPPPKRDDRVNTFLNLGREERTNAIVAAAYRLLDEGGLDELTIRAVLKSTGLARRAFYERFAGKDDLVLAVFEQAMRYAAEMYADLVAPIPQPLDRLKAIVLSIGRGAGAPDEPAAGQGSRMAAALSREHIRLAESRPAELQAALEPLFAVIAKQIGDGMAAGQIREGDPDRLALFIYNLLATTLHTEFIASEGGTEAGERRERLADDLWEFCRRAIIA
jgi:AcrR family transcriptional regulator